MQGAHARPIVAQLTPGDPRPIAAAQNVPAERSGIECREGQPPSRQPATLPPLVPWLRAATAIAACWRGYIARWPPVARWNFYVARYIIRSKQRLERRTWAARAIAHSWRHYASHYWTKLDQLLAATAIAAGRRGHVARWNIGCEQQASAAIARGWRRK